MEIKRIKAIRALKDNYIWAIINQNDEVIIVDPGEAKPVNEFLSENNLKLIAILITHHHWDHTNGITRLVSAHSCEVYGANRKNVVTITHQVADNELININNFPEIKVLSIPGHTLDHVAYSIAENVFTGDTLFGAGCGRVFEGTAAQMYDSLQRLANLPANTKVYCGHEYTLANLRFAKTVEPTNFEIDQRIKKVSSLINQNLPSLPTTVVEEKSTNPFLRCDKLQIKAYAEDVSKKSLLSPVDIFTVIRKSKDHFTV